MEFSLPQLTQICFKESFGLCSLHEHSHLVVNRSLHEMVGLDLQDMVKSLFPRVMNKAGKGEIFQSMSVNVSFLSKYCVLIHRCIRYSE